MASSIVSSTAKQLGGLIVKEAQYLYEVSDKIECLQQDLEWMLCFLEDADNRQNREKVVAKWITTIREFTYEAEEIIETYLHKVSNPRQNGGWDTTIKWWLCALNDARALHEVGTNIDGLRVKIEQLISRLQLYGVKITKEDETKRNIFVRKTYSHVEENPVGLEEHIAKVVEQLVRNEQVKIVGIWGMGGLGKTTLAGKVVQDKSVKELFSGGSIAWVSISKQFETRKVFMEILMGVAGSNDEERMKQISKLTDGELPQEICRVLSQRECLVVLDDLWECHDWDALKPAFESIKSSGSKILITTRNRGLTEHIDPLGYSHNPNLLSDDDSWRLFQRIAFARTETPVPASEDNGDDDDIQGFAGNGIGSQHDAEDVPVNANLNEETIDNEEQKDQTTEPVPVSEVHGDDDDIQGFAGNGIGLQHDAEEDVPVNANLNKETIDNEEQKDQTTEPDEDMKAKEKLGREMLKHCKGLPLAILTLGGVLCNKKTLFEWQNVQKNIKSYLMGDSRRTTSSNNNELFVVLELSYNDLPYYLKPCFMYLGHFPEDYEVSVDRLYHLWEAEGLVTTSEDDDVEDLGLDDIAESYLYELIDRCLVQVGERWVNGRIKTCRLHDVVRLMCIKKCKEVNFLKAISAKETSTRKVTASSSSINMKMHRCALYLDLPGLQSPDEIFPVFVSSENSAPCIRSLLVFQDEEDEESYWESDFFTKKLKYSLLLLRVLDLEGARIPIHRKGIKDLIHLRYLSFNCAWLRSEELPDFWDCKYLETLDLRCGKDVKLSNKLWRLQRLRHLYLPYFFELKGHEGETIALTDNQLEQLETLINCSPESFDFKSMWKMTSLRVFGFKQSLYYWYSLSREDVVHFLKLPMIATRRQPTYPLRIDLDSDVMNGDQSLLTTLLAAHACISELTIRGRIEDVSSLARFDKSYLTTLDLHNTEIGQQGISVIEKFLVLTQLSLMDRSFVGKKMSFSCGGFPKLNILFFREIEDLEEWEISEGAVPNLQILHIWSCKKLKMIPSGLPGTVRVYMKGCPSVITI